MFSRNWSRPRALTLPILKKAGMLTAIEFDRDLIPGLKNRCAGKGDLTIYQADALSFDYQQLIKEKPLRLIGIYLTIFPRL